MPRRTPAAIAALTLVVAAAQANAETQEIVYDATSGVLTIPSVSVGSATFTQVTLLNTGNYTFALQGASAQVPAAPATARYDTSTNVLWLPAVQVGGTTFLDVTLLNAGNYTFTLQGATALDAQLLADVRALMAADDALWAQAVPAAATRLSLTDSCYRADGRTKEWIIADHLANAALHAARDAPVIGKRIENVRIVAVRDTVNPDASTRREVDAMVDIAYADGTRATGRVSTLISGSSSGTAGCTTPQTGPGWRFLGNQKWVGASVRVRNVRDERYALSNGAALSPAVNYRRDLQFQVTDPMGNATYVVITGPGPTGTANGASVPFSLKLLSPLVLRSAPELAGKNGNYLNWLDDDSFRYCRISGSSVPVAEVADCAGQGATSNTWGTTTGTPNAAADASFDALGFVAGASYVVQVYKDDGWKTVNGHAGRTPIATYTATVPRLPYTFVEMAGTGPTADAFPRMTATGMTAVQMRDNLMAASPQPMNLSWTALPAAPDGRAFGLWGLWEYFQGPKTGNANNASYPGYRSIAYQHPGSQARSVSAMPVTAKPTDMSAKKYGEFTLQYLDRNDVQVVSDISFN